MGTAVLATQRARTSATIMILSMLNRIESVQLKQQCKFKECSLGPVFYLRLTIVTTNEKIVCICKVLSHWLKPYSTIDRERAHIFNWKDTPQPPLTGELRTGLWFVITVKCRYNTVHYNIMLHASLEWRMWNINQNLNTQKAPHI